MQAIYEIVLGTLALALMAVIAAIFLCVPLAFVMNDAGTLMSSSFRLGNEVERAFWLVLKTAGWLYGLFFVTALTQGFNGED